MPWIAMKFCRRTMISMQYIDKESGITAYAFFEAAELKETPKTDAVVKRAENPCMVMECRRGADPQSGCG